MGRITGITKTTENKFLNMYNLETVKRTGRKGLYHVASRAADIDHLKITTRENKADGVLIFSLHGEKRDRVVLVRQYRYSIDDYIYELPAGLVEDGEDFREAAVRELKEETGLDFHPLDADPMYSRPFFTTIGMTDESCAAVYGTADGVISEEGLEEGEEIETVIADRNEVRRILKEENVSLMCAYMLMYFLNADPAEPFGFLDIHI